ncbi:N-formylglutamate amidohydrolase [Sinirhodobacter populi]|uniref:N-formylglutamate amidohydrolase n=1 Tax=Paenirhodobacter populi TaxID=2306993 RepID=A0A443K553_9RHOB|nr:N-formylglutamate amidohydrolase [Sinirhodobacter populi]RWR27884.1 N-formylglutamate amidohydrolase [Sinirhodobacter populi]
MTDPSPLLGPDDQSPVEVTNPNGASPIVLLCEHAGRAFPRALGPLGLSDEASHRHIAWDIGAEGVSRALAGLLDATLVTQRYSRLVVDCNRPFEAVDLIPEVADLEPIPGNAGLTSAERRARFDAIHRPYHDRVVRILDARGPEARMVTIHSFTPMLRRTGVARPWHIGLLYIHDDRLARRLKPALEAQNPGMIVAYNEPYQADEISDYALPVHGEGRGLEHVMIEIRNDLIATPAGQAEWAGKIAAALRAT